MILSLRQTRLRKGRGGGTLRFAAPSPSSVWSSSVAARGTALPGLSFVPEERAPRFAYQLPSLSGTLLLPGALPFRNKSLCACRSRGGVPGSPSWPRGHPQRRAHFLAAPGGSRSAKGPSLWQRLGVSSDIQALTCTRSFKYSGIVGYA